MKKSYLIAIVMSAIIVVWMTSGLFGSAENDSSNKLQKAEAQKLLVETQQQTAQAVQLSLTVQGQVEPLRQVSIRSDIDGRIKQIVVQEGTRVNTGDTLFTLDPEDRDIKLAREKAMLLSRQQSYERTQKLAKQGLQAQSALEEAYAALKTAEASVAQIELELSKLAIKAPFDGVIDQLHIEEKSYVSANTDIAQFIDNQQLVVVAPVAQQDINKLSIGIEAKVDFATGQSTQGKVHFISSLARESTRTFRVEIIVDNNAGKIPAGISAELEIPVGEVDGHFVSPAILALDATGQIGVKSVDSNNKVVFTPVSIIKASTNGIWVKGLPEQVNIITVGQGFVEAGTEVNWALASNQTGNKENEYSDRSTQ